MIKKKTYAPPHQIKATVHRVVKIQNQSPKEKRAPQTKGTHNGERTLLWGIKWITLQEPIGAMKHLLFTILAPTPLGSLHRQPSIGHSDSDGTSAAPVRLLECVTKHGKS